MKLYNTLTRQICEIKPQQPPVVTVYTCGITVNDYAHIGHWFTYVRADILIRVLKTQSLQPKWVMNITDVGHLVSDADEGEDKLEKGARREGKTAWQIAEYYTQDFLEGMKQLNILSPDIVPRATDHILQQIALIQKLESKGFTYVINDGVYYDTSKFPQYADFALLDLDEQRGSGRVPSNSRKRQAADFAVWKFSPEGEQRDMEWQSPWGKGFPGWHIECSAMSMKYLGETLDLHTGGIDHLPVHHTNEIAQSQAATGKLFVNHWMHSNHVMVEGNKISKSLGNGIRLAEVISRGVSPLALRLHVLESHYRTQAHFSWDNLEAAQNRLETYQAMADAYWQPVSDGGVSAEKLDQRLKNIAAALVNDLNTPAALADLSQLETAIDAAGINIASQKTYRETLEWLDEALGLQLQSDDISDAQKQLIKDRDTARHSLDWTTSDVIRKQLKEQGIIIRDSVCRGTVWSRRR